MNKLFYIVFCFIICKLVGAQEYQETQRILSSDFQAGHYFGSGIAANDQFLMIGTNFESTDENGLNFMQSAGAVYVYQKDDNNNWVEVQKLVASDRSPYESFGYRIVMDGDYAVIGAPQADRVENTGATTADTGAAYIFKFNTNTGQWGEIQKIIPSDAVTDDMMGEHMAFQDGLLVFGVNKQDTTTDGPSTYLSGAGAAYVYEHHAGNDLWEEMAKITHTDRVNGDQFGSTVCIDNQTLFVGAHAKEYTNQGALYIFKKNASNTWEEVQKINSPDISVGEMFGDDISVHQNIMAVSAIRGDTVIDGVTIEDTGVVYMFENTGENEWVFVEKIQNVNNDTLDGFGDELIISDSALVIASRYENSDENGENELHQSGTVYIYSQDNSGNWNTYQKIVASDRNQYDAFGTGLALSNDEIFVGANLKSTTIDGVFYGSTGAAYVFSNAALSVDEVESSNQVKIFPNPVSDALNIQWKQGSGVKELRVVDITGRVVSSTTYENGADFMRMDTSNLSAGPYVLVIKEGENSESLKFIKQ